MGKGLVMNSDDQIWLVSADHVHPDYRFQDTETRVRVYEDGTAIAQHPKLGCGKMGNDLGAAICSLFRDHACYMITWKEKPAS
jgi:hypothetical protein